MNASHSFTKLEGTMYRISSGEIFLFESSLDEIERSCMFGGKVSASADELTIRAVCERGYTQCQISRVYIGESVYII